MGVGHACRVNITLREVQVLCAALAPATRVRLRPKLEQRLQLTVKYAVLVTTHSLATT